MHKQPFVTVHGAPIVIAKAARAHRRALDLAEFDAKSIKGCLGLPVGFGDNGYSVWNAHDVDDSWKTGDRGAIEGRDISTKDGALPNGSVHQLRQLEVNSKNCGAVDLTGAFYARQRLSNERPILLTLEGRIGRRSHQ